MGIIRSLFFFFMEANTSTCFIVRGMVMSLGNVRQSRMCLDAFFMFLLEIKGVMETLLVCGNVGGPVWSC